MTDNVQRLINPWGINLFSFSRLEVLVNRIYSLYSKVSVTNFEKIQVQVFFGFTSTWAQWEGTDWDSKENSQSCYICLSYYWLAMINMENYIWLEGGWEKEQMATKRILEQLIVTGIFPGQKFKSEASRSVIHFFLIRVLCLKPILLSSD